MFYTCNNCGNRFSDNEPNVIIEGDFQYCCSDCRDEDIDND